MNNAIIAFISSDEIRYRYAADRLSQSSSLTPWVVWIGIIAICVIAYLMWVRNSKKVVTEVPCTVTSNVLTNAPMAQQTQVARAAPRPVNWFWPRHPLAQCALIVTMMLSFIAGARSGLIDGSIAVFINYWLVIGVRAIVVAAMPKPSTNP